MAPRQTTDQKPNFRLLFENHPQPMWIFDRKTLRFLDVNQAAVSLYGYSRAEFLGMKLTDIRPAEDVPRLMQALTTLESSGQSVGQWRHRLKDGRVIDVQVATHRIKHKGHKGSLTVVNDITQLRLLEDQLRQAQRMEAVGMLAGGVAHDFNNLLTIINGYSQLVLASTPVDDSRRVALEQIMKAGERAAALTRQLLAFSRRQAVAPKVLDPNDIVTGLGSMLRRLIGEDVDLRLNLASDVGRVSADPGQVEQVIMNLVVNARDAMPRGGALTIETSNVELDEQYKNVYLAVSPGPYVLLAISDTGVGMTPEVRAHLFEPFFTTKAVGYGTGLGLSTVFGIVKQSGGSLEVHSERDQGTLVNVYFPRVDQPVHAVTPHVDTAHRRGTETLLLVEDEEVVRRLVRETLEREGYRVLDAPGADQAEKLCRKHHGPIHLMITDVIMPGLNGRELAERLLALRPAMKVLYMSGYTDNAVISSRLAEMKRAFLQKPFTPAALARKVREVLEEETTSRASG